MGSPRLQSEQSEDRLHRDAGTHKWRSRPLLVYGGRRGKHAGPAYGSTQTGAHFGDRPIAAFVEEWTGSGANHFSLSIGRNGSMLRKLASALTLPYRQIQ